MVNHQRIRIRTCFIGLSCRVIYKENCLPTASSKSSSLLKKLPKAQDIQMTSFICISSRKLFLAWYKGKEIGIGLFSVSTRERGCRSNGQFSRCPLAVFRGVQNCTTKRWRGDTDQMVREKCWRPSGVKSKVEYFGLKKIEIFLPLAEF